MASSVTPFPSPTTSGTSSASATTPSLAGTLDQMPLPDLLQTSSANGRTGRIDLEGGKGDGHVHTGRIWMRDGRLVDAALRTESSSNRTGPTDADLVGRDALYRLLTWTEGRFALVAVDVDLPDRIQDSTSFLLLDAMRQVDEDRRAESPGHAGLPEEPPEPSPAEQAVHLSLLLLNVTTTWVGSQMRPNLIVERFHEIRDVLRRGRPLLDRFEFDIESGLAGLADTEPLTEEDVEPLVASVGLWLRGFYRRLERSLPGRFSMERLAELTGAHAEQLTDLDFHRALGWQDHWPEDDTTKLAVTPEPPRAS